MRRIEEYIEVVKRENRRLDVNVRTVADIKKSIQLRPSSDRDEIRHWLDVHQDTQEMIELVVRLTQSYHIWLMFMGKQNAEKCEEVLREYSDFFEPIAHILLWQGFFVIFCQIFDRDLLCRNHF